MVHDKMSFNEGICVALIFGLLEAKFTKIVRSKPFIDVTTNNRKYNGIKDSTSEKKILVQLPTQ